MVKPVIVVNKKIQFAVDRLYKELKDIDYGKEYKWEELMELAGLPKDANMSEIYYIANKVCLMMMQFDQKYLVTVVGVGKRIINPAEHSVVAKHKVKRSVRLYRQAGAVLSSTNTDMLTSDQKRQVIEDANKYSTLEMFANEVLKKKQIGISTKDDNRTAGLFLDAIKMFTDSKKRQKD